MSGVPCSFTQKSWEEARPTPRHIPLGTGGLFSACFDQVPFCCPSTERVCLPGGQLTKRERLKTAALPENRLLLATWQGRTQRTHFCFGGFFCWCCTLDRHSVPYISWSFIKPFCDLCWNEPKLALCGLKRHKTNTNHVLRACKR